MNFKSTCNFLVYGFFLLLTACGDSQDEAPLVDLFTAASLDIIAIDFPAAANQEIISVNSFFDYSVEGLKSNGIDKIPVTSSAVWSLSAGALSSIDQNGRLSAGSTAENITITAAVGHLSQTFDVRVSAAKFDQVIMLNITPVSIDMCQAQQIIPIGNYINDDGSADEERPVDSSVLNTITWLIRNADDNLASQRALIKTEANIVYLQALQSADVIIQARAPSVSQGGTIITSVDFDQPLNDTLNTIKICLKSASDLATCDLTSNDIVENNIVSLMAVGNYQQSNGSTADINISELSKWGIDNNSNASIALSEDRQQLDVTGKIKNTVVNISVACGNVEQTIQDSELVGGVVLSIPVTCVNGSLDCFQKTQTMNVIAETIDSLSVTVNGQELVSNTALLLSTRPTTLVFEVTANLSDGSSRVVTQEATYINSSTDVVTEIAAKPGEYTVLSTGNNVDISILLSPKSFVAKVTLPN